MIQHKERSVNLGYTGGGSDKVYYLNLTGSNDEWNVKCKYGKRWNANNVHYKFASPVSHAEAEDMYEKLLNQKLKKGYIVE
jgi:bifunctional non-homologous end joining protein LigD